MSQILGWLLTSQIVLFAAYGILLKDFPGGNNKRLIFVIEGFGITIACLIFIGIVAAIIASYILYFKVLFANEKNYSSWKLRHIKNMMERSRHFISLSGLSGINENGGKIF